MLSENRVEKTDKFLTSISSIRSFFARSLSFSHFQARAFHIVTPVAAEIISQLYRCFLEYVRVMKMYSE